MAELMVPAAVPVLGTASAGAKIDADDVVQ